jgi:glyoxylase I family protein
LGLPARDPVALKDWYARVLGARVVFGNDHTPPAFLLALPGQVMLEIYGGDFSLPQTSNNKLTGWRHVALRVDSVAAAKDELERHGLKFTEDVKPAGGGGRVLFFQDPEGNLLHLVERTAEFQHPPVSDRAASNAAPMVCAEKSALVAAKPLPNQQ